MNDTHRVPVKVIQVPANASPAVRSAMIRQIMGPDLGNHEQYGHEEWVHTPLIPMSKSSVDFLERVAAIMSVHVRLISINETVALMFDRSINPQLKVGPIAKEMTGSAGTEKWDQSVRTPMSETTAAFFIELAAELSKPGATVSPMQAATLLLEYYIKYHDYTEAQALIDD